MADEFEVEGAERDYITVRHLQEGHRFTLLVVEGEDGERVLSDGVVMRENLGARRRGSDYTTQVRAVAEREARAAGLID